MKAAIVKAIAEIEQDFHRRAFGEERARIYAMRPADRQAYVARVRRRAGASLRRNAER